MTSSNEKGPVLGHDIEGTPIRAGVKVVLVGPRVKPGRIGNVNTVADELTGWMLGAASTRSGHPGPWLLLGNGGAVPCDQVRVIKRINDANETTQWSEVEKAIGWMPPTEKERVVK